jgi:tripartite-type tricarboxylate transporter receptor subunit TctC
MNAAPEPGTGIRRHPKDKRSATMNLLSRSLAVVIAAGAAVFAGYAHAAAGNYPNRPVRLIVGFPPGGAADILARAAAAQLAERLGQQVVVDNRGGAGGLIATETAARANADGYTLLFSSIPHVINPHLYKKVSYDALKDFAPVVQFVSVPLMMAAGPSLPAQSVKELIDHARANPDRINYGSGGSGSSSHLAMELFKSMTGTRMTHVPYKGTGPLITDMLGGQIALTIASAVPLGPQVRAGKLRGLAVTGPKRSPAFPNLPAVAETVKGYEVVNWFGVFAPAGTPRAATARINSVLNEALRSPELLKTLQAQGAEAVGGPAEDFERVVRADFAKWGRVVRESGARVD